MSNWNLPAITSGYLDFVTEMNDKFVDAGTIGYGAPTNLPEHAMRFNRSTNIFEEWVLNAWVPKVIGIAGGGTGGSDPASARAALGLGSMSVQNSNAVNITGGSITGVNLNADAITSGIVALARGGTGASLALGAVGTVLLSNGSAVVFAPGTSITSLSASALTTGTVPLDRLAGVGKLDIQNVWNALNYFNGALSVSPHIEINAAYPGFYLINTTGLLNEKRMYMFNYLGQFIIQTQNDDGSFKGNPLSIGTDGVLTAIGTGLTLLNGSNIASGIVPAARLGTGPASAGTFLRGDNVWAPATGGTGDIIPPGLIAMFDIACPVGWTRYAAMDNRFPLGHTSVGLVGGNTSHAHGVTGTTDSAGSHGHYFRKDLGLTFRTQDGDPVPPFFSYDGGGASRRIQDFHQHNVPANFTVDGNTDAGGAHAHNLSASSDARDHMPPYFSIVYCRKD